MNNVTKTNKCKEYCENILNGQLNKIFFLKDEYKQIDCNKYCEYIVNIQNKINNEKQ